MRACFLAMTVLMAACAPEGWNTLEKLVEQDAEVKTVESGLEFTFLEGPAWHPAIGLVFSDIPANAIYRLASGGGITLFREQSNGSNGLMFDHAGSLVMCEGGAGRITSMEPGGEISVVADSFRGMPFNSPNDLVIDARNGIYFTDPRFGGDADLPQDAQAVYYRHPDGQITRTIDDVEKPNGIILSPDGGRLYVADSSEPLIHAYKVSETGLPVDAFVFAVLKETERGADGLTVDERGNLYVTSSVGVQLFNDKGHYLGTIEVPEVPANVTFGESDLKTLYITARRHLYTLRMRVRGVVFPLGAEPSGAL